ncbi:MAG TPA: hypothetical protein VLZ83_17190 [Edaphocola sp.]|nr:hypothetical protein [Edaphocola sp.]
MRKYLMTGLVLLFGASTVLAQYTNDPYNDDSKNRTNNSNYQTQQNYQNNNNYNSYNDNYDNNNYDNYNDGYIDYDDDSYTSRIRRFGSMNLGYNYWSPVYSPYWAMPVFLNPWYYSPYVPGFSLSFGYGWGGSPYWYSGYGMGNWWGFNRFNYWSNPYYGYGWGGAYGGWGYHNSYWNGYNDGLYGNRRNVNYGIRNNYNTGFNRTASGVRANPGTTGKYSRRDGAGINTNNRNINSGNIGSSNRERFQNNRNDIQFQNGERRNRNVEQQNVDRNVDRNTNYGTPQRNNNGRNNIQATPQRQQSVPSKGSRNVTPQRNTPQPSREYTPSKAPSKNYSAPSRSTPSRSYSAPSAPSRSYSAPSGGGSRGGRR